MERIRLGRTGMMVSKLGFGGLPIQRVSEEEAVAVVKKCMELGITFFDTAIGYTTSEGRIGKAIRGHREGLFIATKTHAETPERAERDLELSLKRFGVEYIDLYQFHQVSTFKELEIVLGPKGPLPFLEKARKKGTIKHIGITSHSLAVAIEAVKSDRFETVMVPFNFIEREAEDEILPLARERDVGFIAMKPLAGGMLDNITLAFKYLLRFPDVLPIPGIERPEQIEEIVRIFEGPKEMSEAEEHEMQRMREELGTKFCRRCDYCQPCTEGISIWRVMINKSFARLLTPERFFLGENAEAMEKAANCCQCGACEERCPYGLPIREMIAERVAWYEKAKREYQERTGS